MKRTLCDVLGNTVRVRLILCISHKAKNVSDLVDSCHLSQSAISQHLAILRDAGVVSTKRVGKQIWYKVKDKDIREIAKRIDKLLKEGTYV